jgi:hypothetical protein
MSRDHNDKEPGRALAPRTIHHHGSELRALQDDANVQLPGPMSGVVATEKSSKFGIGVVQLAIKEKQQSYRSEEAMLTDPGEPVDGARWVTVKPNTSLKHVVEKYGPDLIGYEAQNREMALELFSFDMFETSTRSVRVLVRGQ